MTRRVVYRPTHPDLLEALRREAASRKAADALKAPPAGPDALPADRASTGPPGVPEGTPPPPDPPA
jgi:hypothetical protein